MGVYTLYTPRRLFFARSLSLGATALLPHALQAAWPEQAFGERSLEHAIGGIAQARPGHIIIEAPQAAESQSQVAVSISTDLPEVDMISIVIAQNACPLACRFLFKASAEPYVATRVRINGTSELIAVVRSKGTLYSASKQVRFTGCSSPG